MSFVLHKPQVHSTVVAACPVCTTQGLTLQTRALHSTMARLSYVITALVVGLVAELFCMPDACKEDVVANVRTLRFVTYPCAPHYHHRMQSDSHVFGSCRQR